MKLLHTSDWHLGARLGRHDRQTDHQAALHGLLALAESEEPDLILHTGDLFDASRPPYVSLGLGITALQRLAALAPTVALCGNHDSPALFRVLDQLADAMQPRRLWFVSQPQVLELSGVSDMPVAIACVPFIPPSAIADFASDEVTKFAGKYADGVRVINDRLLAEAQAEAGEQGIVLYAAHLHVDGAKPGKSERRITVGEDYATHVQGLQRASYCAFGHIHDPQLLPGGIANGRYAGSLIPLDFGESCQTKQAVVVEIADDVQVRTCDLPSGRPLTPFEGTLAELEHRAEDGALNNCILKARVDSDEPVPDLADRLAARSPKCAVFELVNVVAGAGVRPIDAPKSDADQEPSESALFGEWLTNAAPANAKTAPAEEVMGLFSDALTAAQNGTDLSLGLRELEDESQKVLDQLSQSGAG